MSFIKEQFSFTERRLDFETREKVNTGLQITLDVNALITYTLLFKELQKSQQSPPLDRDLRRIKIEIQMEGEEFLNSTKELLETAREGQ